MGGLKKILKWTDIILLFLIMGITLTVMGRQNIKWDLTYPAMTGTIDNIDILRGKQLVFGAAHCAGCHSKGNADCLLKPGQELPLTGDLFLIFR